MQIWFVKEYGDYKANKWYDLPRDMAVWYIRQGVAVYNNPKQPRLTRGDELADLVRSGKIVSGVIETASVPSGEDAEIKVMKRKRKTK